MRWVIVSYMAHLPTNEADVQRVYWIAKELGISLEDAAVTYAGFERAFSDESLRREIFEMIDRLDDEAYKKGEPLGLIISYTVELERDGIRVGRYADHIPAGEVIHLTPTDRAMIFLRINDNFPTQQFLGPLIVNRPVPFAGEQFSVEQDDVKLPSLDKEGCPVGRGGLNDSENYNTDIPNNTSPSRTTGVVILLGPIRLKLDERFPCLSTAPPAAQRTVAKPLASAARRASARAILSAAASSSGQSTSGLSPPLNTENLGHSKSERCPERPPAK